MDRIRTFSVPDRVSRTIAHAGLGYEMVRAWQADGAFQVSMGLELSGTAENAFAACREFFELPAESKSRFVSDLTYSGYAAPGEEVTVGVADSSEVFIVGQDHSDDDHRVRGRWPCHGPVPWPSRGYRRSMHWFMGGAGALGDRLLRLIALGLGLPDDEALRESTVDGWHHLRAERFPPGGEHAPRRGGQTDHGLLVIVAQHDTGGLDIAAPGEAKRKIVAGPAPRMLTVFPGDALQFLTDGFVRATSYKLRQGGRDCFALTYFHEPDFDACLTPVTEPGGGVRLHYGTQLTTRFMRSFPDRVTSRRILEEDRLLVLARLRERAISR